MKLPICYTCNRHASYVKGQSIWMFECEYCGYYLDDTGMAVQDFSPDKLNENINTDISDCKNCGVCYNCKKKAREFWTIDQEVSKIYRGS